MVLKNSKWQATTLPSWKGGREGGKKKIQCIICYHNYNIILENELKHHSNTIEDLYLVQARNKWTKMGKAKRMIDVKPITELLLWGHDGIKETRFILYMLTLSNRKTGIYIYNSYE